MVALYLALGEMSSRIWIFYDLATDFCVIYYVNVRRVAQ